MNAIEKSLQTQQSAGLRLGDVMAPAGRERPELWPELQDQKRIIAFTVLESATIATKTYGVDEKGRPIKTSSGGSVYKGYAKRIELAGTLSEKATAFKARLEALTSHDVLILTPPPNRLDGVVVVEKKRLNEHDSAVARTQSTFMRTNAPAIIGLDFDAKEWPEHIRAGVRAAGGLGSALSSVFAGFQDAICVDRRSVSTGIVNTDNNEQTSTSSGLHKYLFVTDGTAIPAFADVLFDRLFLAGFGYAVVNGAGAVMLRTLVDLTPTKGSERLWFEADAVLQDPRLSYGAGVREPKIVNPEGGWLELSKLPPLSADEKARLTQIKSALRASVADEVASKKAAFRQARTVDMIKSGATDGDARRAAEAVERGELIGAFPIKLDDGRTITVDNILDDPATYDGLTAPDPVEPDYHGGASKAIIYTDGPYPLIHSQAHGGQTYVLRRDVVALYFEPFVEPVRRPLSVHRSRVDVKAVPTRQFLVEPLLAPGIVTLVVGEPGISKSTFSTRLALIVAAGRKQLLSPIERLHATGAVLLYNAEDSRDEMQRRLAVAQIHSNTDEMQHDVVLWSGVDDGSLILVHRPDRNKGLCRASGCDLLERRIVEFNARLVVLDPQISLMADGNENSNDDVNVLLLLLAEIAAKYGCAIVVVHHTAKGSRDDAGDMGAGRGGFAGAGKARSYVTLTNVTGDRPDEKAWGVKREDQLIRLDYAKVSHGKKPTTPQVFRRLSVSVGNGFGVEPGAASALFPDDPAEELRAVGDYAPVLELVDIGSLGRHNEAGDDADRIASAVVSMLGTASQSALNPILPAIGEILRGMNLTTAQGPTQLKGLVTSALRGQGRTIKHDGQYVRVVTKQIDGGRTAAWYACQCVVTGDTNDAA